MYKIRFLYFKVINDVINKNDFSWYNNKVILLSTTLIEDFFQFRTFKTKFDTAESAAYKIKMCKIFKIGWKIS